MKLPLLNLALWRDIKATYQRYLSLIGITAIGVLVLVGLMTVSPYMVQNGERLLENEHTFDLTATSTYGFDLDDQALLRDFATEHGLLYAFGRQSDLITTDGYLLRVESLTPEISVPTAVEGRLPENIQEIALDADLAAAYPLGSTIHFHPESDKWGMREEGEHDLHHYDYTVVGHIISMNYLDNTQKGNSPVGHGHLDGFAVVCAPAFTDGDRDFLRLRLSDDSHGSMVNQEYKLLAATLRDEFKTYYAPERDLRFERMKTEIADAIADGEKQLAEGEQKLADAHQEVADAEEKLAQGRQDYAEGQATYDREVAKAEKTIAEHKQDIADAHQKIADGEKDLADGQQELSDAKKKLDDGQVQLDEAREELDSAWDEWSAQHDKLEEGRAQYEAGRDELAQSKQQVADGEAQLAQGQAQLDEAKKNLPDRATLEASAQQLQQAIDQLNAALADPSLPEEQRAHYQAELEAQRNQLTQVQQGLGAWAQIDGQQAELDAKSGELQAAKAQIVAGEAELAASYRTLEEGQTKLDEALKELEAGQREFDDKEREWLDGKKDYEQGLADYEEGKVKLANAKTELAEGERKLADGEQQLADKKAKGERELADARRKINEGQHDLDQGKKTLAEKEVEARADMAKGRDDIESAKDTLRRLKAPILTVSSRYDHPIGLYFDNSERVTKMAAIFPVFLFAIALLVTLTTMTRMVDEKRMFMGTMKALGYRPFHVGRYFVLYGSSAACIGGTIGTILGHLWLGPLIAGYYSTTTIITGGPVHFYPVPTLLAFVAALLATGGVSFLVVNHSIPENASALMRPKVPKSGTRIFLERITPLWSRMSFTAKVTARNLFRFKQRFLMTVIGVAGCVSLIFMGYALRGSLHSILDRQYSEIAKADVTVLYDRDFGEASYQHYQNFLNDPALVRDHASIHFASATSRIPSNPAPLPVSVIVPLDNRIDDFISWHTRREQTPLTLSDQGAIITEKLAKLHNLTIGDNLVVEDENNHNISIPVTGITENYASHYIYLTPKGYAQYFGEEATPNADLIAYVSSDPDEQSELNSQLTDEEAIMGVLSAYHFRTIFSAFIGVLDNVVYVIIGLSSALAIIVLYNLTNINISERIRELSTVKVLGFYDREVTSYIFREVWVLTIIGIVFGFLGGAFLHYLMLQVTESYNMMFDPRIVAEAFYIPTVIVIVITFVVERMMQRRLHHVDMVEALKAIE